MDKDNIFYIYMHIRLDTNTPFYIGKGKLNRAKKKSKRNSYWKNIVNKHGYKIKIMINNLNEIEAFKKEIYFIQFYKQFGFCEANLTNGGEGPSGYKLSKEGLLNRTQKKEKHPMFGKKRTEEERRKISEKLKGRKLSPERIKKSREALLPIIQSEEYKQKMRQSTKYLCEARQKKLIDSNGIIYNSIKEASEKLKINKSTIHRFLKGINKTLKIGITLKYYIEDERIQGQ